MSGQETALHTRSGYLLLHNKRPETQCLKSTFINILHTSVIGVGPNRDTRVSSDGDSGWGGSTDN